MKSGGLIQICFKKSVWFSLLLSSCLILSGCFEMSEEIWISTDGSGRIKEDFIISDALLGLAQGRSQDDLIGRVRERYEEAKKDLEKNSFVKRVEFREYSEGGMHHFSLDVTVRQFQNLNEIQKKIPPYIEDSGEESDFRIEKLPSGNISFRQKFGESPAESTEAEADTSERNPWLKFGEFMAKASISTAFGNRYFTVRLHAPKIVSTNGNLDDRMQTAEWKLALVDLLSENPYEQELKAEMHPPGKGLLWIVAAILLVAVIGGITLVTMRRRKRGVEPMAPAGN